MAQKKSAFKNIVKKSDKKIDKKSHKLVSKPAKRPEPVKSSKAPVKPAKGAAHSSKAGKAGSSKTILNKVGAKAHDHSTSGAHSDKKSQLKGSIGKNSKASHDKGDRSVHNAPHKLGKQSQQTSHVTKADHKGKEVKNSKKPLVKGPAVLDADLKHAAKSAENDRSDSSEENLKISAKGLKAAKKSAVKAPKKAEENAGEIDDVGLESDDLGTDEIGEYEEELKAVEEADSESDDEVAWLTDSREKESEEIVLTDAEGRRYCRSRDCDQIAMVDGYCRYHYLLFWKRIQIRKKILADDELERYVEELTARYPDKFLEMIRRDLRTEKDFLSAIQELEIDEGAIDNDYEEDTQSFIEEVRVIGEGGGGVEEDDY